MKRPEDRLSSSVGYELCDRVMAKRNSGKAELPTDRHKLAAVEKPGL